MIELHAHHGDITYVEDSVFLELYERFGSGDAWRILVVFGEWNRALPVTFGRRIDAERAAKALADAAGDAMVHPTKLRVWLREKGSAEFLRIVTEPLAW